MDDKKKRRTDEEKMFAIRNHVRATKYYTNHELMEMMKMIVDGPSKPGGRRQGLGDRISHPSQLDKYGNFLEK